MARNIIEVGESGINIRNAINNNFTENYSSIETLNTSFQTLNNKLAVDEQRITVLENKGTIAVKYENSIGHNFVYGELCVYQDNFYGCIIPHTAVPEFNTNNWKKFS